MDPRRKALIALGAAIPILGGVLFAVTRGGDDAPPPTTEAAVTTTTVPVAVWPLTGLPAPDGAPLDRAAIASPAASSRGAQIAPVTLGQRPTR